MENMAVKKQNVVFSACKKRKEKSIFCTNNIEDYEVIDSSLSRVLISLSIEMLEKVHHKTCHFDYVLYQDIEKKKGLLLKKNGMEACLGRLPTNLSLSLLGILLLPYPT